MAAHTSDIYPDTVQPDYTDEIDLRRYLSVLASWWREILAISILAGLLAGVTVAIINFSRIPTYAASADLIIARLSSNIELDDRISTTSSTAQNDISGWRTSLLQLVKSGVVANQVLEELGSILPKTLHTPDALLRIVSAEIPLSPDERSASNLIRIRAETTDPGLSAQIANSWARHLVTYINGLYGEVPETMIASVVAEHDQSLLAYQSAQKALEEFIVNSQASALSRQVEEKETLRNELMVNHTAMMTAVVSTDYKARLDLYQALVAAPLAHTENIFATQLQADVDTLRLLYELRGAAMTQLNQARTMERSLVEGGEAAAKSNVDALRLLKLAAFSSLQASDRQPLNFSFLGTEPNLQMGLEEQLADVRALVIVFEEYIASLNSDIEALANAEAAGADLTTLSSAENRLNSQQQLAATGQYTDVAAAYAQLLALPNTLDPLPSELTARVAENHEAMLTQLEQDIQSLRAALSAEDAHERQLVHQRDQAWTTYETVGTKLQELNLLRSSANSEVRLGNPALPPMEPLPQLDLLLVVAAAILSGLIFSVLLALLINSLGGSPLFARHPA